jgi:hypothetical protein
MSKNRDIRCVGVVDVKLHAFLVSPLDGDKWSSRSSRFIPGKTAWVLTGHGGGQDSQPVRVQRDENNSQFPTVCQI